MIQTTVAEKNLTEARQKLLDLTMRNKLLNHRASKNKSIRVVDEITREIYNILVIQHKQMEFKYNPETDKVDASELLFEDVSQNEVDQPSIWSNESNNEKVSSKHLDKYLQTNLGNEALQKTLFLIYNQAKTVMEEQGYTVLFLALGFLEWKESSDSIKLRRSPLILIPVELERTNVRSAFKLTWTGDEIYSNISLQAKLSEQNVSIPSFEMPDDKQYLDLYFDEIIEACKNQKDWGITQDIYLDFFSFTKFVMYKDLDPISWIDNPPLDSPLIKMLLDPNYVQEGGDNFLEEEIDIKLSAKSTYNIMDADPSQIVVIENVKQKMNIVVEGPPGTGKSQTITNLIADLLAEGKSVLFVSEKMAALEVVKNRLDLVGLGDFCLELHSRKTNKKNVLAELERTFKRPVASKLAEDTKYQELDDMKLKLNNYASALKAQVGKIKWTPYKLFSLYEEAVCSFEKNEKEFKSVKIDEPEEITIEDYQSAIMALNEFMDLFELVAPIDSNPWKASRPDIILPADQQRIKEIIDDIQSKIKELKKQLAIVSSEFAIINPPSLNEFGNILVPILDLLSNFKKINIQVLLNNYNEYEASQLILNLRQYKVSLDNIRNSFNINKLDEDISKIVDDFKTLSTSFTHLFKPSYYCKRKEFISLFRNPVKIKNDLLIRELEGVVLFQQKREMIYGYKGLGDSLFGEYWKGIDSDIDELVNFVAWIKKYQNALNNGWILKQNAEIMNNNKSNISLNETEINLKNIIVHIQSQYSELSEILKLSESTEDFNSIEFSDLENKLSDWTSNLHSLQKWSHYITKRSVVCCNIAKELVQEIENGKIEIEEIIPAFKGSIAKSLLDYSFNLYPALSGFLGEIHDKNIKRFSELDNQIIRLNRQRLVHILSSRRPTIYSGKSDGSEMGILQGEFNRKRGHMPIRKLLSNAGSIIRGAKPCFMMSPLSIAQFLSPASTPFDVIIFDEASQVKPEDALGALMRGRQLVVMGDTKQLPPTSFFDHIGEELDFDEDEMLITATESILHQCKRCFPVKMLKWHYRSKHESLIAVSNQEFYENELLIYPSSIKTDKNLGLFFKYLPDTIYDRGKSSINRLEARAVAKAAIEHYQNNPDKSLGIGTFNMKQQQAVLEEIELQLKHHPEMEDYFKSNVSEHFFVKNLETIQGDERDFIIISIGFGYDADKKLSANFGPLNHEGGERRLNVLISRARECCIVYSNFRAADLSISAESSKGVRSLKVFIDYAESRNLRSTEPVSEDTDSPFEDSVYDFLSDNGHIVRKQVGCAGFRIDLAIVDEKNPGRYLLAIECDGAKYHSSPVARDRDRLRQQILEKLGWNIYRIWSTDWYRNRHMAKRALLNFIEKIKVSNRYNTSMDNQTLHASDCEIKYNEPLMTEDYISLIDSIPEYEICNSLLLNTSRQIHEINRTYFSSAIESIVNVESPVHIDEVIKRIRTYWGLQKTGSRIRDHLTFAIKYATRNTSIELRNNFLYLKDKPVIVRKRTNGEPSPDINLICDEEIQEAILHVLKNLFSTEIDSLAIQASRLFGIQATRAITHNRIKENIFLLQKQHRIDIDSKNTVRIISFSSGMN